MYKADKQPHTKELYINHGNEVEVEGLDGDYISDIR
jgi:hypothetical protein